MLNGFNAPSGAKATLLETRDELKWNQEGSQLRIEVPRALDGKLPRREVYVLKLAGVKAA